MRTLPKPDDDTKKVFLDCISNIRKDAKKNLELCADEISDFAIDFDSKKDNNEIHKVASSNNIGGIVSNTQMSNVYKNKFADRRGPGRKYYDKLITLPRNGICPICGQREVSTLDHYLPKMKYPHLAVTPINLIPTCKDCNFEKGEFEFSNEIDATLHPYYDSIDDAIWLGANLKENKDIVFSFEVLQPAEWDDLIYERVKNHFKIFKLNRLYSVQAAVEFEEKKKMIINIYKRSGRESVKIFFMDCLDSCEAVNLNSWKCGMYRTLIESDWFYNDWLKVQ